MRVIPFFGHHLNGFEPQEQQRAIMDSPPEHIAALEASYSFSVVRADGVILAVGGLAQIWNGRWTAWCALSVHAKRHLVAITRLARTELAKFEESRIEACTDIDFPEGARWLELLGFECEVPHAKKLVPGQQLSLYVRA